MNFRYSIAALLLTLFVTKVHGSFLEGTVYMRNGKAKFIAGVQDQSGAATGSFNNTLYSTGWSVLNVKAGFGKSFYHNEELAYAAGYFEGVVTASQIWDQYQNLYPVFLKGKSDEVIKKTKQFFLDQDTWMRKMISTKSPADPLWRHISYITAQFDGLYAGYKSVASSSWDTDIFVIQLLNGNGDLIDLMKAIDPSSIPDYNKMKPDELLSYVRSQGHCSALIKVTGAYEDIFMAHSSWFVYQATNRIYKHYNLNFNDDATAAKNLSFSSYPGFLESLDDFYILSSKMVLLQTTNNIFDASLYKSVQPQSLFAWQRVRAANHIASNGKDWSEIFSQYNSGTYNNQYMIIDLKKIELGVSINDGALWVVEQIPTKVSAGDVSPILRTGYWPSYNVPFFEDIYNMSGYPNFVKSHGLGYSYQLAPRAKIYRRDQDNVTSVEALQFMMRYNEYKTDPYSDGNPCNAICCRGDLDPTNPRPDGCYDSKVTDYNMALKMQSFAINGPSKGINLKPFSWTDRFNSTSHIGLPKTYNFPWLFMQPT